MINPAVLQQRDSGCRKVKNLKISQKIERSEQVKFSVNPFFKRVGRGKGRQPQNL